MSDDMTPAEIAAAQRRDAYKSPGGRNRVARAEARKAADRGDWQEHERWADTARRTCAHPYRGCGCGQ